MSNSFFGKTSELKTECQFRCPGCPAEAVLQNIAKHRDDDPSSNGVVLFGVLTQKKHGPIDEAIQQGANTYDEIMGTMSRESGSWSPAHDSGRIYGDLTKREITEMAVRCMLRKVASECTLEEMWEQRSK